MKTIRKNLHEMRSYLLLWFAQMISGLGSAMTSPELLPVFHYPTGIFSGRILCRSAFEPLMAAQKSGSILQICFGEGKGSGAACCFAVLWLMGIGVCLLFRKRSTTHTLTQ